VLDVACGTGVLARQAAKQVGDDGLVAAVDVNPGMLVVARQLAPGIDWQEARAESLPFADRSFDVVVSQFGLMFFTDRRAALREMLRVLVPGGRLAVAVWDTLDHTPAYAAEVALLERVAGTRAADALRAPFVLGNRQELDALFAGAGVTSLEITTQDCTAKFPSVRSLIEADLRGWLPIMGVDLPEEMIQRIVEEAEHVFAPYVSADGTVEFGDPAHVVTGTKS
jgi:SAM-dependent methyltransferase